MGRFIGIRHRVKRTAQGEARPTQFAIKDGEEVAVYTLDDDTAELDFVLGRFPVSYRHAEEGEDLGQFLPHHMKRQKRKGSDEEIVRVPSAYDGLKPDDTVGMVLGGSGDRLAFALSRRAEEIGARVLRIPPFVLKARRGGESKDDDHRLLMRLVYEEAKLFYPTGPRDRDFIRVREAYRARRFTQQDRIRCEQRLRQQYGGQVFLTEDGRYPEGSIEAAYDVERANDEVLAGVSGQEERREREVVRAVRRLDIWQQVLSQVEGYGEVLAAGVLSPVVDIRRFIVPPDLSGATTEEEIRRRKRKAVDRGAAKLKAYLGVHVLAGGKYANVPPEKSFPRQRRASAAMVHPVGIDQESGDPGEDAPIVFNQQLGSDLGEEDVRVMISYVREARQSLYLFGDQCNYRPDSFWGQRFRKYKAGFRERHPEVVLVRGKKHYTDIHIHRMGRWRTLTRFVEWLYRQWLALEMRQQEGGSATS